MNNREPKNIEKELKNFIKSEKYSEITSNQKSKFENLSKRERIDICNEEEIKNCKNESPNNPNKNEFIHKKRNSSTSNITSTRNKSNENGIEDSRIANKDEEELMEISALQTNFIKSKKYRKQSLNNKRNSKNLPFQSIEKINKNELDLKEESKIEKGNLANEYAVSNLENIREKGKNEDSSICTKENSTTQETNSNIKEKINNASVIKQSRTRSHTLDERIKQDRNENNTREESLNNKDAELAYLDNDKNINNKITKTEDDEINEDLNNDIKYHSCLNAQKLIDAEEENKVYAEIIQSHDEEKHIDESNFYNVDSDNNYNKIELTDDKDDNDQHQSILILPNPQLTYATTAKAKKQQLDYISKQQKLIDKQKKALLGNKKIVQEEFKNKNDYLTSNESIIKRLIEEIKKIKVLFEFQEKIILSKKEKEKLVKQLEAKIKPLYESLRYYIININTTKNRESFSDIGLNIKFNNFNEKNFMFDLSKKMICLDCFKVIHSEIVTEIIDHSINSSNIENKDKDIITNINSIYKCKADGDITYFRHEEKCLMKKCLCFGCGSIVRRIQLIDGVYGKCCCLTEDLKYNNEVNEEITVINNDIPKNKESDFDGKNENKDSDSYNSLDRFRTKSNKSMDICDITNSNPFVSKEYYDAILSNLTNKVVKNISNKRNLNHIKNKLFNNNKKNDNNISKSFIITDEEEINTKNIEKNENKDKTGNKKDNNTDSKDSDDSSSLLSNNTDTAVKKEVFDLLEDSISYNNLLDSNFDYDVSSYDNISDFNTSTNLDDEANENKENENNNLFINNNIHSKNNISSEKLNIPDKPNKYNNINNTSNTQSISNLLTGKKDVFRKKSNEDINNILNNTSLDISKMSFKKDYSDIDKKQSIKKDYFNKLFNQDKVRISESLLNDNKEQIDKNQNKQEVSSIANISYNEVIKNSMNNDSESYIEKVRRIISLAKFYKNNGNTNSNKNIDTLLNNNEEPSKVLNEKPNNILSSEVINNEDTINKIITDSNNIRIKEDSNLLNLSDYEINEYGYAIEIIKSHNSYITNYFMANMNLSVCFICRQDKKNPFNFKMIKRIKLNKKKIKALMKLKYYSLCSNNQTDNKLFYSFISNNILLKIKDNKKYKVNIRIRFNNRIQAYQTRTSKNDHNSNNDIWIFIGLIDLSSLKLIENNDFNYYYDYCLGHISYNRLMIKYAIDTLFIKESNKNETEASDKYLYGVENCNNENFNRLGISKSKLIRKETIFPKKIDIRNVKNKKGITYVLEMNTDTYDNNEESFLNNQAKIYTMLSIYRKNRIGSKTNLIINNDSNATSVDISKNCNNSLIPIILSNSANISLSYSIDVIKMNKDIENKEVNK